MGITVGKLFGNAAIMYQMKLLAGQRGINNLVEWVHIIENDEVSAFLHGNEVVFTSGILNNKEDWLIEYTKKLYKVGTSAFVVNIGPYIKKIPKEVSDFCDKVEFPLYTIPWETRIVDVTRDICYRIMQREQVELSIEQTIKNIIFKVGDIESGILQMERYGYLRNSKFCFVIMEFNKYEETAVNEKEIKRYCEEIARSISELCILFTYYGRIVVVLVDYSSYDIDKFTKTFFENKNWDTYPWKIHMGVSENKEGIEFQEENFNRGLKALKLAHKKDKNIIMYDKTEIYKLFLDVKEQQVLKEYYNETLGKIEKYDNENKTDLLEFLKIYLQSNGSPKSVSERLFIHRNTVNNQLKKIEKLTNRNLLELEEKMKLFLAYYIKDLL